MKTLKRRRREFKTDYLKRLKLLKGKTNRLVLRKTNRYIIAEYVISTESQDKVKIGITSKELIKYGWPKDASGSLKSLTASYFTGLLIGKKIINEKLEEPIIDFGMQRSVHKSRIYAFLKGLVDSGMKIKYKKEIFPENERIEGKHLKNKIKFNEIKSKIEKI